MATILKQERDWDSECYVEIDGKMDESHVNGRGLQLRLELDPNQEARLRLHREELRGSTTERYSIMYGTKVFLRRHLSEFRDNYIAKSRALSKLVDLARGSS